MISKTIGKMGYTSLFSDKPTWGSELEKSRKWLSYAKFETIFVVITTII
jgi:hypothetical protein